MESMTLAKALVELKLLDKRVAKKRVAFEPVAIKKGASFLSSAITSQEAFERTTLAEWQSMRALLDRRRKIKSAIITANAHTEVTVAGVAYTIAEAIEQKNAMKSEQEIVTSTRRKLADAVAEVDRINSANKDKLLKLLEAMYAKRESQVSADDQDAVAKPFNEANEARLVDPVEMDKALSEMEDKIDRFLADVDVCLSVANATTSISVRPS